MKTVAAVNFRGGVGKTTTTWLLAKYVSEKLNKKVLVIDIDPQMSLTMALEMKEGEGILNREFKQWYSRFKNSRGTLLRALQKFEKAKGKYDFSLNSSDIYKMSDTLYFIPSTPDLYWLEFDICDKEKVRSFIASLQNKIAHSVKHHYDFIFYDCPPQFNSLAYSVLSNANTILIPFNPDMLASKELVQMLEGLASRLKPLPELRIAVLMNKAKTSRGNYLTTKSKKYLNDVKSASRTVVKRGFKLDVLNTYIPEKLDISNLMNSKKLPLELEDYFRNIWDEIG